MSYIGSTEGCATALSLGPKLTDSEFRVLVLMAECPSGHMFACDFDYFVKCGMAEKDAQRAIVTLAMERDLNSKHAKTQFYVFKDFRVEWRFYK